ncbi:MAG: hypothetical protein HW387_878 [Parachlamydiales bacterium]|nr:hypothetical protein [Parachlamydiales bacterium]
MITDRIIGRKEANRGRYDLIVFFRNNDPADAVDDGQRYNACDKSNQHCEQAHHCWIDIPSFRESSADPSHLTILFRAVKVPWHFGLTAGRLKNSSLKGGDSPSA